MKIAKVTLILIDFPTWHLFRHYLSFNEFFIVFTKVNGNAEMTRSARFNSVHGVHPLFVLRSHERHESTRLTPRQEASLFSPRGTRFIPFLRLPEHSRSNDRGEESQESMNRNAKYAETRRFVSTNRGGS